MVTARDAVVAAEVPGRIVCDSGSLKITPVGITEGSKSLGSLVCFSHFSLRISIFGADSLVVDCPDAVPKATTHRNNVQDNGHFNVIRGGITMLILRHQQSHNDRKILGNGAMFLPFPRFALFEEFAQTLCSTRIPPYCVICV